MTGNFIGDVRKRDIVALETIDMEATVAICSVNPGDKCKDVEVTGNTAAGSEVLYGFIAYAHNCGDAEN